MYAALYRYGLNAQCWYPTGNKPRVNSCRPSTRFLLLGLIFTLGLSTPLKAQIRIKKTVFQGFWWDYWNGNFPNGWANYLTELAPRLKAAGFNAVWLPPVYKNGSTGSVGYSPFDMYDLGDKYQKGGGSPDVRTRVGTKDELLRLIAVAPTVNMLYLGRAASCSRA